MISEEVAVEMARKLVDVLLDVVPHIVARDILNAAAIRRANDAADLAEIAKFGEP